MPIVVVKVVVAINMEPTAIVNEPDSPNIVASLSLISLLLQALRFLPSVAAVFHSKVYAVIN